MDVSKKYICVHGHFYQPPRENAWLEVIETQDSATPFHDWNERINFECYATNAAARILDDQQSIIKIVNNYIRISFNFGPTLLSWLEHADPDTYQAIINADLASRARFGGHGSAMAQVHSHLILPLANRRDKETQIKWGIRDFEFRFNRKPEGIWLSETAVDTETLEILVDNGIKFTLLAPRQARAFRKIGDDNWIDLPHSNVDSRRPYLYKLPSGRSIALFFYHGGIAQGVAFDGLLNNGKNFAQQFINAFDHNDEPQIAHIATDGESYGHHHRHGEMALADALNFIEDETEFQLTNYGQYLELFPPTHEILIHENSSWSCVHGIERWRSSCGCNTGGRPDWNQDWRAPLRQTLNWVRDQLIPLYESEASKLIRDVWDARDSYINVLLNRNNNTVQSFIQKYAIKPLSKVEEIHLLRLMEMQRHAMLMFTSCGWFFDEISGIETDQILQYANRAIHYAQQTTGIDLHPEFIRRLEETPSNAHKNGATSYQQNVMPARVDLIRVAMHYAVSSLFDAYPEELEFLNYVAKTNNFHRLRAGKQMLALGQTTVKSQITSSEKSFSFAVLYLGQHNIIGNISIDMTTESFLEMAIEVKQAFHDTDLGAVIGVMQSYFGPEKYSIWHLFRDTKRKIFDQINQQSLKLVEHSFRDIYKENYQLLLGMEQSNIPIPEAYKNAIEFIVNQDFHQFFENGSLNIRELNRLSNELRRWNLKLVDEQRLKLAASERIFQEIRSIVEGEDTMKELQNLNKLLRALQDTGLRLEFWKGQNLYYSLLKKFESGTNEYPNAEWKSKFEELGLLLQFRREPIAVA